MTVYSDFPGRRIWQILGDLVTVALVVVSIAFGVMVHDAIMVLAKVGVAIEDAGAGFRDPMQAAGETLGGIPLIGPGIRAPFDAASEAGSTLADAGIAQQEAVGVLATSLGFAMALVPILVVLLLWVLTRLRFILRATELRAVSRMSEGVDLLALRALMTAPASALRKIPGSSVSGWRDRNPEVMAALATIELRDGGLRRAS